MESILGNLILGDQIVAARSQGGETRWRWDHSGGSEARHKDTKDRQRASSVLGDLILGDQIVAARSLGGGSVGGGRWDHSGGSGSGGSRGTKGKAERPRASPGACTRRIGKGAAEFAAGTHSMRGGPELKHCTGAQLGGARPQPDTQHGVETAVGEAQRHSSISRHLVRFDSDAPAGALRLPHVATENRSGTETCFLNSPYPMACLHTPFFWKAGHEHSYLKRMVGAVRIKAARRSSSVSMARTRFRPRGACGFWGRCPLWDGVPKKKTSCRGGRPDPMSHRAASRTCSSS